MVRALAIFTQPARARSVKNYSGETIAASRVTSVKTAFHTVSEESHTP